MKNNFDPVGNLLTNSAIFAFCLMFLVLLVTLTGCGASQTDTAPATVGVATSEPSDIQAPAPVEVESVAAAESITCADFRKQMTALYTSNYYAGDWDGTPVSVTHEDHDHTIKLAYSQTVVIDDVMYGDINLPAGAYISMCIKQGQERTYLQEFDETISAYHAGDRVANYTNPQGYDLCMSLQSPADDVKYLIAKDASDTVISTLAVFNLETKDWQELSTNWADGQYWFSETGKTLFYQDIDGQAYKFDLMLTKTEPEKISEHYNGKYWAGHTFSAKLEAVEPGPIDDYEICRDLDVVPYKYLFVRNVAELADPKSLQHDMLVCIEANNGAIKILRPEGDGYGRKTYGNLWTGSVRYADVLDADIMEYDGDNQDIASQTLTFLIQSYGENGDFSLDFYEYGLDNGNLRIANIAKGPYGNASLIEGSIYYNCGDEIYRLVPDYEEAIYTHDFTSVQGGM